MIDDLTGDLTGDQWQQFECEGYLRLGWP